MSITAFGDQTCHAPTFENAQKKPGARAMEGYQWTPINDAWRRLKPLCRLYHSNRHLHLTVRIEEG